MSHLSTHVLDVTAGVPAAGVEVELFASAGGQPIATGTTDADGRVGSLGPEVLAAGDYRLRFHVGAYFAGLGLATLYPTITIDFAVGDDSAHLHLPVLVSPFAYSTYRGS